MRDRYVIAELDDTVFTLGLDRRTDEEARAAIRWQRKGGFTTPYHVCTYDPETREFVSVDDETLRFRPVNGSFTKEAWERFLLETDPKAYEEGGFGLPEAPSPSA
jgi:hypothetical protein